MGTAVAFAVLGVRMSAHGCMTPCPQCKQGCPICHPCKPECGRLMFNQPGVITPRIPMKCDLCGSTAIDHTEMHCQLNRNLGKVRGKIK